MDIRTRRRRRLMKAAVKRNQSHDVAEWKALSRRLSTGFTLLELMGRKQYTPQLVEYCERSASGRVSVPALADLKAMDVLESLQADLAEAVAPFGWYGSWLDVTGRMAGAACREALAKHASAAGRVWVGCMQVLARLSRVAAPREPESYVGQCPACGRAVYAARQAGSVLCPCGYASDVAVLKAKAHSRYLDLWVTRSDRDAAGFLSSLAGRRIPVGKVRQWRERGRVTVRATDEPGVYRWNIATLVRQAERMG